MRVGQNEKRVLWHKLARIAPLAAATSVDRATVGELRADPEWRPRSTAAIVEACAVADADGVSLRPAAQWAIIDEMADETTTSAARDVVAGTALRARRDRRRRAAAAERLGVPCPTLTELAAQPVCGEHAVGGRLRPGPLRLRARAAQERPPARRPPAARLRDRDRPQSGCFERVVVSTDSEEIADVARWYGADVPFLRPAEYATSTSPDIEWLAYTLEQLDERYDLFALVRATNPFRGPDDVRRGLEQLLATPEADSIRAVELVKQHPGKMWLLADDGRTMRPLLDQSHLDVAWHAGQYQALPRGLRPEQRARDRLDARRHRDGTREGEVLAPFLTQGLEGFNVDDEEDWERAERLVAARRGVAAAVDRGLRMLRRS